MTIAQIQVRRGTAAQWTSANPILADGEWGLETDTGFTKMGLGGVAWNSLNYFINWNDVVLTGNPTAPTPAAGDDDTSIATTAFVRANIQPYVDLRASAATSILHNQGTYTKVNLATTVHNSGAAWFTVAASVVTIVQTGLYDINVRSGFASGSAFEEFAVSLNGLAFANAIDLFKPGSASTSSVMKGAIPISQYALTAGDTIQIGSFQFQSAGSAALNTSADSRLLIRKTG